MGPSPPIPRSPVLQERTQKASDVQSSAQVVKPKPKAPTNLKLTGQYLKIGYPSCGSVYEDRQEKYLEMKVARKEAKELVRDESSQNPSGRYAKGTAKTQCSF